MITALITTLAIAPTMVHTKADDNAEEGPGHAPPNSNIHDGTPHTEQQGDTLKSQPATPNKKNYAARTAGHNAIRTQDQQTRGYYTDHCKAPKPQAEEVPPSLRTGEPQRQKNLSNLPP